MPPSTSERRAAAPPPEPHHPTRRRAIGIGAGAVAVAGLGTWLGVRVLGGSEEPTPPPSAPAPEPTGTPFVPAEWMSGAAGEGVADGSYAAARGSDLDISATWFDNNEAMLKQYTLQPGAEYASWSKPLDVALGAIDLDDGESWARAAQGAYDDRWRESLTRLRDTWGSRPGTVYIRFAHELNGNWYGWRVRSNEVDDFKTAWARYRALQQEIFPASKLVLCMNRETVRDEKAGDAGIDWRTLYPGDGLVDVMSVDYYNQFPSVESDEGWEAAMVLKDQWGAPKGLQGHLDFARTVGLPLAVSEWSGNAEEGDMPVFVRRMHDFFTRHGGTGAGQVLYEIQFNVDMDGGQWLLVSPKTRMPESAAMYTSLAW
ncbi:glycosyl hydrolase [Quadrisphaera granulorum]|nr:glycosyl hydrolase [Quadrisphaera granulorum]